MVEYIGTAFFFLALVHTFLVSFFAKIARRFPKGSASEAFFHLLSEVEVVFGFWAFLFLLTWSLIEGVRPVIDYQESLNLVEPLFIFCIMVIASTRPIVTLARYLILFLHSRGSFLYSRVLSVSSIFSRRRTQNLNSNQVVGQFFILLTVGPLLGSLITEPAAITITALLLYRMIDIDKIESSLLYGMIGLLFVNISVGGALTHFAAPPILIVARTWGWGLSEVFMKLGIAALAAVFLNTILFILMFKKKIFQMLNPIEVDYYPMPFWVIASHVIFLGLMVLTSHHPQVFIGLFLIFIGLMTVTNIYQDQPKFKESLLVAFFLAGLIVFGSFQRWWLEPLISSLSNTTLFLVAGGLTAITDNAALTYLGSQVPNLTDLSKWSLVAGALVGGGLTILANAPNPAGFSILSSKFPNSTLNAFKLFKAAILPTIVAGICFYLQLFVIF